VRLDIFYPIQEGFIRNLKKSTWVNVREQRRLLMFLTELRTQMTWLRLRYMSSRHIGSEERTHLEAGHPIDIG
jgi:hypothetical protein